MYLEFCVCWSCSGIFDGESVSAYVPHSKQNITVVTGCDLQTNCAKAIHENLGNVLCKTLDLIYSSSAHVPTLRQLASIKEI